MEILYDGRVPDIKEAYEEAALVTLQGEGLTGELCQISVTFVSPEEIREWNRKTRDVDKVTDVLSYPQFEPEEPIDEDRPYLLGDVLICSEQAERQAEEYGHSREREFVYLFVHSLLHLLGYDHMEEEEKKEMRAKEEAVMEQLNLPR